MRENNNTQERHKIHVFMANIWIQNMYSISGLLVKM